MQGLVGRADFGRWGAALVLSAAMALPALPAHAEDGGFFGFLSAALGGGGSAPPAASPPPSASGGEQVRPLTVRRAHKKPEARAGQGRVHLTRLPAKSGPVSIYEDPTLRDGDAVMTKDGMRVFAGARFSPDHPYAEADFVAVSASKAVAPNLRKTVIELNKLPHG